VRELLEVALRPVFHAFSGTIRLVLVPVEVQERVDETVLE